jgi:Zn-dependent protease with chaperone function
MFINWVNNIVAERAYSRKLEMEADAVGLDVRGPSFDVFCATCH